MYVFHDQNGNIKFTATGGRDIIEGRDDWIEVPAQDLGDLSAWRVLNDELTLFDIEPHRRSAKDRINELIGNVRLKYITNIPGQDPIYLKKEIEAKAYIQDPNPNIANYPFLSSEVGITAQSAYQLAQIWLYMSSMWNTIAASLEAIRMGSQYAIDAASSQAEIETILATAESQISNF